MITLSVVRRKTVNNIDEMFSQDTVFLNIEATNEMELFYQVAMALKEKDFVTAEYYDGLIKREREFPTGLRIAKYGVAIPHTDPEYIVRNFIAVVRMKEPVQFSLMEDNNITDYMNICFFIGLKEGKESPKVLMNLITLIQNSDLIYSIMKEMKEERVVNMILEAIKLKAEV